MSSLWIPRRLLQEAIAHCRSEYPNEACGLLAGHASRVVAVLPMPNTAPDTKKTYLVDAVAQGHAFNMMADKGWELIGIYHSHPSAPPTPSQSDIRQAYYPQALHMIIGLLTPKRPDVRVYRLIRETGKAVQVPLESDRIRYSAKSMPRRSQNDRWWLSANLLAGATGPADHRVGHDAGRWLFWSS